MTKFRAALSVLILLTGVSLVSAQGPFSAQIQRALTAFKTGDQTITGTWTFSTAPVVSVAVGSITGLGTGVATALAANTGASGGFATNGVAGVAAGYKLARGAITLDGSNPSSAATTLATIVSCTVSGPAAASIPTDDPMGAIAFINSTSIDLYAWKTDGTDPTPVASTNNTAVFYWICIGT